jgi:hypothetical protein
LPLGESASGVVLIVKSIQALSGMVRELTEGKPGTISMVVVVLPVARGSAYRV